MVVGERAPNKAIKNSITDGLTDIGRQALEKATKFSDDRVEVRELSTEQNKKYMATLVDTALKGKGKYHGNYYVIVLTKRERLIARTLRNYFFTRQSCPTPSYEQAVYVFDPKQESLDFLWIVPSKDMCIDMYQKRLLLDHRRDPLMPFVVDFIEGKLLEKAKFLNNEIQG